MAEESEVKKHVDEAWKNQVEKEREENKQSKEENKYAQPTFFDLVGVYVMQVMFFLGLVKDNNNPDFEAKVDLESARINIDMLTMLYEKTKGNLTPEESTYLTNALNELRMVYIQRAGENPMGSKSSSTIITP